MEATVNFIRRKRHPLNLMEQVLAYICLKFKAESLYQHQLMEQLPNSICKSICQRLFLPISERVYMFKGVSREILLHLVTKMIAEYLPPCKDVIMQNESPGNLYIIASGEVEMIDCDFDKELVVGRSRSAEMFGVVGSLCRRPQSFIFRTMTISRHPFSSVRFGFSSGFKGSGFCWYWIFWVSRLGTLISSHPPLASFVWLSAWGQAEFQKWGRGRYDKKVTMRSRTY
ncbi:Potassium channel AKT2/3 [Linum grandiflorum]